MKAPAVLVVFAIKQIVGCVNAPVVRLRQGSDGQDEDEDQVHALHCFRE